MRDRVFGKSAKSLTDLELLETFFYRSNPRGGTKPIAKRLMHRLRKLAGVLSAPVEKFQEVEQVGQATIVAIKVTEAAALHLSHSRIKNQPVLSNWMHVQDYCINRLAHKPVEHFVILCLDSQNQLIGEETISIGTIDQTAVYPREVVNAALEHQAQSVTLVHNHPSGEAKTSRADIAVTRDIEKALTVMGMTLHNHLIIADIICVSFKSLGHL